MRTEQAMHFLWYLAGVAVGLAAIYLLANLTKVFLELYRGGYYRRCRMHWWCFGGLVHDGACVRHGWWQR